MRPPALCLLPLSIAVTVGCASVGARPGALDRPAEIGYASYYSRSFHGQTTASGSTFDRRGLTAAHRTLPFGTRVRVTNLRNRRSVIVTITDRGPFRRGRVIDLSPRAARTLGFLRRGIARVRVEVVSERRDPTAAEVTGADARPE